MIKRIILIVMDSVGIGEMPDAAQFGDQGSNTVGNILNKRPQTQLPNLRQLGLFNIDAPLPAQKAESPLAAYGKAAEKSPGKDTTTGHWEIAGVPLEQPFPTYPEGFPGEVITAFEAAIKTKTLGNYAASGTVIIEELGEKHLQTGYPIVYTSADSVFQIAMHEDIYPIERQYEICQIARDMLTGEHAVGRVIARPFAGQPGDFYRTANRKDFSLLPPSETVLKLAEKKGLPVWAVGKMNDIYAGEGISRYIKSANNDEGISHTLAYMSEGDSGLILTNLVDFDMLYGHRNDVEGYAKALEDFDRRIPEILGAMLDTDILFITADHGCDPTTAGTDHSREYVPILIYGKAAKGNVDLGTRPTFADIGATIADMLKLEMPKAGTSFFPELQLQKEIHV